VRNFAITFLLSLSLTLTASAQKQSTLPHVSSSQSASSSDNRLPVKKVVLYKNGIGYFEHSAHIYGNQDLSIDFTSAQLNDALKSLTAVDLGDGRISSIRYNSVAPLDERLKALRLPFGEQVTRADFLFAMRGARVEVRNGTASASGRLLSVEKERRANGKGDFYDVTEFSIVTDSGDMKNFELGPATSVRLAERDLSDEVGRYLNLVGSSRARDSRRMTLSATGSGDRNIFVSYISEVPVWKSTYRIILPTRADEKPVLQGWAIVDNTVGEDWNDVQLSLVAGSPQSFVQQISQPYYARRPVMQPPASAMLTPQTHEGTMSGEVAAGVAAGTGGGVAGGAFSTTAPMAGPQFDRLNQFSQLNSPSGSGSASLHGSITDSSGAAVAGARVTVRNEETGASQTTTTDSRGIYEFYNIVAGNSALFVNSPGFRRFELTNFYVGVGRMNEINGRLEVGGTSESVAVQAATPTLETSTASIAAKAGKQHIEAESTDLGDYFEYNIKQKISIGKNQSALVPILQSRIDAEKVSLWNEESKEIRRALWITNSSGLTLDSGTFNILDSDTFAGEGLLDTVHASERRLISYAADPALRITMDQESSEKPATHIRIAKGLMYLAREQRESRKYTLHNADTQPRQVIIEHPAREGWKLTPGPKAEETSASFLRFRIAVGPDKTEELKIEEFHPEQSEVEIK
jgi:hypothetical protein